MKLSGYLVIQKKSVNWKAPTARFVLKAPSLSANEISVKLEANIPDELFTRPQLKFQIDIPKSAVPQKEITAEVTGNIADIIKQNLGIDITLIAQEQE